MLSRLLSIFIIGFWIVTTGLLLRSIWFPADSRLTEVSPGAVFQLIAARGEASALDIYDDRTIVGNLSVLAGPERSEQGTLTRVKLNGQVNLKSALLQSTRLDLNCQIDLDHGGSVQAYHLTLITLQPSLTLILAQPSPDQAPVLLLKKGDTVLLDSSSIKPGREDSHPFIAVLLGSLGLSPAEFLAIRASAEAQASSLKIEARQGTFELGGTNRQGFVLKMGLPSKPGFRLYVENTGEIVQLETPVSYRLITESIRPAAPSSR